MAHREFPDTSGKSWEVWDVRPAAVDQERRAHAPSPAAGLESGWLAFQCGAERRRLAPIPVGWEQQPADELCALLDRAVPIPQAKRRFGE